VAVKAVPLSTYTGAEIIDADPVLLRDALAQYHVLAFHDQRFTPAQFMDAAKSFGEPSEIALGNLLEPGPHDQRASAGNAVAAFDAAEISLSLSMAR
jgi:hypothetical protein